MRIGNISFNPNLGKKDWTTFKAFFDASIKFQVTETAEEVYSLLGGSPPIPKKIKVEKQPIE